MREKKSHTMDLDEDTPSILDNFTENVEWAFFWMGIMLTVL